MIIRMTVFPFGLGQESKKLERATYHQSIIWNLQKYFHDYIKPLNCQKENMMDVDT